MSEPATERSTLHRYAHRAAYDRETIDAILDEGFVCHVGLCTDKGFPVVIPLAYGRDGDIVYLHGSAASRLFRGAKAESVEICMTVTFVDGLVVARSTYNTDINYRSVVILGSATEVKDLDEKDHGLSLMVDHIIPGRSADARRPTEKELRSTMLLRLPLTESSAKVRTGFPLDEEEDYDLDIWAGVIPLTTVIAPPIEDPALRVEAAVPAYVERYRRPVTVGAALTMCGVIGLLLRDPTLEPQLGSLLVPMLEALDERGPDSSGIALYADHPAGPGAGAGTPTLRLSLGADVPVDWMDVGCALLDLCPSGADVQRFGAGAVVDVPESALDAVEHALATQWPDVRILGTGWNLRVLKDTGRPSDTCARYGVRDWEGYLAIAHTRMATESAVTVLHSHPFVPDRDLCVVHNGSFSNYATVRRRLQDEGITFDSDNDSEVGARFLATRLALGDDLEEATRWVMKEMDGFFTLVITSADGMSVVRDAFACKPAVVAETAAYVAVASEYRALAELPGIADAVVFEPHPEEVYTWTR